MGKHREGRGSSRVVPTVARAARSRLCPRTLSRSSVDGEGTEAECESPVASERGRVSHGMARTAYYFICRLWYTPQYTVYSEAPSAYATDLANYFIPTDRYGIRLIVYRIMEFLPHTLCTGFADDSTRAPLSLVQRTTLCTPPGVPYRVYGVRGTVPRPSASLPLRSALYSYLHYALPVYIMSNMLRTTHTGVSSRLRAAQGQLRASYRPM
jgi:hypothetical protein